MPAVTVATEDVEVPYLDFQPLLPSLRISEAPFTLETTEEQYLEIPQSTNLFALSNDTGFCAWISKRKSGEYELNLTRLAYLHEVLLQNLPFITGGAPPTVLNKADGQVITFQLEGGGGPPTHIKFAGGGKVLVLAELTRIGWWEIADLLHLSKPVLPPAPHPFVPSSRVINILPQPGPDATQLIVQTALKTTCHSILSGSTRVINLSVATAISWSVRGKQIALSPRSIKVPSIKLIDPANGQEKGTIDLLSEGPDGLEAGHEVSSITYLDNFLFLIIFATSQGTDSHLYGLDTEGGKREWIDLPFDVCPPFGGVDGRMERRHIVHLRNWDPLKHVILLSSGPSTEIGAVGLINQEGEKISNFNLPEDLRPVLPTSSTTTVENVAPMALECDLTCKEEREFSITRYGGDEGQIQKEEVGPILFAYSSEGVLAAWRVRNKGEGTSFTVYPYMCKNLEDIGGRSSRPPSMLFSGSNASGTTVSFPFGTPSSSKVDTSSIRSFPFSVSSSNSSTSTLSTVQDVAAEVPATPKTPIPEQPTPPMPSTANLPLSSLSALPAPTTPISSTPPIELHAETDVLSNVRASTKIPFGLSTPITLFESESMKSTTPTTIPFGSTLSAAGTSTTPETIPFGTTTLGTTTFGSISTHTNVTRSNSTSTPSVSPSGSTANPITPFGSKSNPTTFGSPSPSTIPFESTKTDPSTVSPSPTPAAIPFGSKTTSKFSESAALNTNSFETPTPTTIPSDTVETPATTGPTTATTTILSESKSIPATIPFGSSSFPFGPTTTILSESTSATTTIATSTTIPFSSSKVIPFGSTASSIGFGNSTDVPSTPSFQKLDVVGNASRSDEPKPAPTFGQIGFGALKTTVPAFGQTGFGTSNPAVPAFGQTGFGTSKPAVPAFGQTGFGTPAVPAFGQTGFGTSKPAVPAFGQTGFGTSKPAVPAFGQTGFASASLSPVTATFGKSGFGGLSSEAVEGTAASILGQKNSSSTEGSVPKPGGFASFAKSASAFGGSFTGAFGNGDDNKPKIGAFGQVLGTSTTSIKGPNSSNFNNVNVDKTNPSIIAPKPVKLNSKVPGLESDDDDDFEQKTGLAYAASDTQLPNAANKKEDFGLSLSGLDVGSEGKIFESSSVVFVNPSNDKNEAATQTVDAKGNNPTPSLEGGKASNNTTQNKSVGAFFGFKSSPPRKTVPVANGDISNSDDEERPPDDRPAKRLSSSATPGMSGSPPPFTFNSKNASTPGIPKTNILLKSSPLAGGSSYPSLNSKAALDAPSPLSLTPAIPVQPTLFGNLKQGNQSQTTTHTKVPSTSFSFLGNPTQTGGSSPLVGKTLNPVVPKQSEPDKSTTPSTSGIFEKSTVKPQASSPNTPTTTKSFSNLSQNQAFTSSPSNFTVGPVPLSSVGKGTEIIKTEQLDELAAQFLKVYLTMEQELQQLKEYTKSAVHTQSAFRKSHLSSKSLNYRDKTLWSLSDVEFLAEQLDRIIREIKETSAEDNSDGDKLVVELNSELFRAEIKGEEIKRFFESQNDPKLAKFARNRPLNPEQLVTQRRLQRLLRSAEVSLSQLEFHIGTLREKLRKKKEGKHGFLSPSLDSIERSIRNITIAAVQRGADLEDLSSRLAKLGFKSPISSSVALVASPEKIPKTNINRAGENDRQTATSVVNTVVDSARTSSYMRAAFQAQRRRPIVTICSTDLAFTRNQDFKDLPKGRVFSISDLPTPKRSSPPKPTNKGFFTPLPNTPSPAPAAATSTTPTVAPPPANLATTSSPVFSRDHARVNRPKNYKEVPKGKKAVAQNTELPAAPQESTSAFKGFGGIGGFSTASSQSAPFMGFGLAPLKQLTPSDMKGSKEDEDEDEDEGGYDEEDEEDYEEDDEDEDDVSVDEGDIQELIGDDDDDSEWEGRPPQDLSTILEGDEDE